MEEYRIDVYMHQNNLAESRERAKQLIMKNSVYVNDKLITKPSFKVNFSDKIEVRNNFEYVGRGASKIERAVEYFHIVVENKVVVDIGASTGGFTDYMIKNNAKKVYAIDVGHNQLHDLLKNNERVINLEGTNFRYMDTGIFEEPVDIVTVDVSFISLNLILPKVAEINNYDMDIITLIKPQYEAGRQNIGKNGIIKDKKIHMMVLNNIQRYCLQNNMFIKDITFSPIKGGDGNIEYLAYIKKNKQKIYSTKTETQFKDLVTQAFEYYKNNSMR